MNRHNALLAAALLVYGALAVSSMRTTSAVIHGRRIFRPATPT